MINQNDISKRHDAVTNESQNDIFKNSQDFIGLFGNSHERSLAVVVKKLEKIIAAIYLVSDMADREMSLFNELKSHSLATLVSGYEIIQEINRSKIISIAAQLEQLRGMIRIGVIAQVISKMNADILLSEIDKVLEVIYVQHARLSDQGLSVWIHDQELSQPLIPENLIKDQDFNEVYKDHESKRHQNDIKTTLKRHFVFQNDISKRQEESKRHFKTTSENNQEKQKENTVPTTKETIDKIDRKQKLLTIIKSREYSTIHDIKKILGNINDKTLQRELSGLVQIGVIEKQGNKRWTTYRMVSR